MNGIQLIGQFFGIVAVILGFVSFQMNTQKKVLLVQIATALVFCIHYLLIGAVSAVVLNAVGLIRNIVYFYKDKKIFSGKYIPAAFAVVMGVLGALSWQNLYSLLIIAGLVINTLCLSFTNPQNIRKSMLVSSPLVLLYDVAVMSLGGVVYESVAIISSIIGMVKYRREEKAQ